MSLKKTVLAVSVAAITAVSGAAFAPAASARPVTDGPCNYTVNEPVLSYGSQGAAVAQMQCQLNVANQRYHFANGYIAQDASFGPATLARVKAFQAYFGLEVDGYCGPNTWRLLDRVGL